MATVRTNAAPNPAIFNSDPLEQIYAKHLFDPRQSGYAAAFLTAAQMARGDQTSQYLDALRQANIDNVNMQTQDNARASAKDLGELSHKLAKDLGIDFGALAPGLARAFNSPEEFAAQVAKNGGLAAELIRSKIAANQRAGAGGAGGEVETLQIPTTSGVLTLKSGKGTPLSDAATQRLVDKSKALGTQRFQDNNEAAGEALRRNLR